MSSYSLPRRYQSYLGANFLQRQMRSVADALPGVIKRGLSETPKAPAHSSPGLPEIIPATKSRMPLYLGLGAGAVLLLTLLGGRRSLKPAGA